VNGISIQAQAGYSKSVSHADLSDALNKRDVSLPLGRRRHQEDVLVLKSESMTRWPEINSGTEKELSMDR